MSSACLRCTRSRAPWELRWGAESFVWCDGMGCLCLAASLSGLKQLASPVCVNVYREGDHVNAHESHRAMWGAPIQGVSALQLGLHPSTHASAHTRR